MSESDHTVCIEFIFILLSVDSLLLVLQLQRQLLVLELHGALILISTALQLDLGQCLRLLRSEFGLFTLSDARILSNFQINTIGCDFLRLKLHNFATRPSWLRFEHLQMSNGRRL